MLFERLVFQCFRLIAIDKNKKVKKTFCFLRCQLMFSIQSLKMKEIFFSLFDCPIQMSSDSPKIKFLIWQKVTKNVMKKATLGIFDILFLIWD